MSLVRISDTEKGQYGVTLLPNVPPITATALKEKFEEKSDDLIIPKFNTLVDQLEDEEGASNLGAKYGSEDTTVQGAISTLKSAVESGESAFESTGVKHTALTGVGASNRGVYVASDGTATVMDYEVNKTVPSDAKFTDTTYESKPAASGGTDESLVTTGEKYTWNHKPDNVVKGIKVGADTVTASGQDTFTFKSGTNMTINADPTTKEITFTSSGGGGGTGDWSTIANKPFSTVGTGLAVDGSSNLNVDVDAAPTSGSSKMVNSGGLYTKFADYYTKTEMDAIDKPLVKYAGSATLSELTTNHATYLDEAYENKFFLITTGGTLDNTTASYFVSSFNSGDVISADSHIAIINTGTEASPVYKYDDFGGFVDISGKADKTELDSWIVADSTVSSGQVSFSNIDDTGNRGYEPFALITSSSTNKNPTFKISSLSGDQTSNMSVTFTTDADNGATVKLRVFK